MNLGNSVELTVSDLVERVLAMTGSKSRVVNRPLPVDDPRRRKLNIDRAATLLGREPRVALEQGLEATAEWFAQEQRESRAAERRTSDLRIGVAAE